MLIYIEAAAFIKNKQAGLDFIVLQISVISPLTFSACSQESMPKENKKLKPCSRHNEQEICGNTNKKKIKPILISLTVTYSSNLPIMEAKNADR